MNKLSDLKVGDYVVLRVYNKYKLVSIEAETDNTFTAISFKIFSKKTGECNGSTGPCDLSSDNFKTYEIYYPTADLVNKCENKSKVRKFKIKNILDSSN